MARCGCSNSAVCNCLLTEGTNVTITGSGNAGSPYVINATAAVDCDDVRPCLSAGSGITYNPGTGIISATAVTSTALDTNSVDMVVTGGPAYTISANVILNPAGLITEAASGLTLTCSTVRDCIESTTRIGPELFTTTALSNYADPGPRVTQLLIQMSGGGGAGGGVPATAASQSAAGSGGAAGAVAQVLVDVSTITFPLDVYVLAGGVGVSGADGGAGGFTGVYDAAATLLCEAYGGLGGRASTSSATVGALFSGGSVGPIGTVADVIGSGGPGGPSFRISATQAIAGNGGSNQWGGGGVPPNSANTAGNPGTGFGGGGSGARGSDGGAAAAGGNGVDGFVLITPIYY